MKKLLLLFLTIASVSAYGQMVTMGVQGLKVPQIMASTKGGSYALPVVFRVQLQGLQPNRAYKYVTRGIVATDFTSNAAYPGAGNSVFLDSGNWKTTSSPSFATASGHDTFWSNVAGIYEGWFGFVPTTDSRFDPGKNVYPFIMYSAIGATDSVRGYVLDSMHMVAFGAGKNTDSCTGIWGKSATTSKNFVALYDNVAGSGRPISMTMIEKDEITISGAVSYYSANVDGIATRWGCVIPNNNANGIRRIENLGRYTGSFSYANTDADGIWGPSNKSTINPTGGRITPIALDENDAALVQPYIEFVSKTSSTTEGSGKKEVYVVRKYSNSASQTVRIRVIGGSTATKGLTEDYDVTEPRTITFLPGGQINDTTKVTIVDNAIAEPDETVIFQLDQPTNCIIGSQPDHTLTIVDNETGNVSMASAVIIGKETDGTIGIKMKMDKAVSAPSTIRLFVKSKGDSSFIPGEFKLGKSFIDSVFTLGKTTGPDSITIRCTVIDDVNKDWDDTFTMAIRVKSGAAKVAKDSICTVIIKDNDGPSYIKFVNSALSISEKGGSIKIKIKVISKKDAGGDFVLRFLSSGSTATQGTDFNFSPTSQTITIDKNTPDTISVSVPIIDDLLYEPTENMRFTLGILGNVIVQKPDSLNISILNDDFPFYSPTTISKQNKVGKVADSLNVKCRVSGTVHGGNMLSGGGVQYTIMDKTAGVVVLSAIKNFGYNVTQGDSVMVQGTVGQINGMVTMINLDTIVKIVGGRALRTPNISTDVDETTESKMTKFTRVILVNSSDWPSSALSANTTKIVPVRHTDGTTDSLLIDAETNIDGTSAPAGYIDVTGIGGQADSTSPYTGRYYLAPRFLTDITASTLPILTFKHTTDSVYETADSISNIAFNVVPMDENFKFDIVVKASGTTAVSPTDYNFTTRTINVIKNNSVSPIKCNISDDVVSDGTKFLVFALRNIVGPASLGADSLLIVKIKDDEASNVKKFALGNIVMYPNPAKGMVIIQAKTILQKVQIMGMDGRIVWTGSASNKFEIELDFASGIYQVKVTDNEGNLFSEPLLVR